MRTLLIWLCLCPMVSAQAVDFEFAGNDPANSGFCWADASVSPSVPVISHDSDSGATAASASATNGLSQADTDMATTSYAVGTDHVMSGVLRYDCDAAADATWVSSWARSWGLADRTEVWRAKHGGIGYGRLELEVADNINAEDKVSGLELIASWGKQGANPSKVRAIYDPVANEWTIVEWVERSIVFGQLQILDFGWLEVTFPGLSGINDWPGIQCSELLNAGEKIERTIELNTAPFNELKVHAEMPPSPFPQQDQAELRIFARSINEE